MAPNPPPAPARPEVAEEVLLGTWWVPRAEVNLQLLLLLLLPPLSVSVFLAFSLSLFLRLLHTPNTLFLTLSVGSQGASSDLTSIIITML